MLRPALLSPGIGVSVFRITIILVVTAVGLTVGPAWIYSYFGWGLFALLIAVPKFLLDKLQRKLNIRDTNGALAVAGYLRWINWDLSGKFWQDMVKVMDCYIKGDKLSAESILDKWQQIKSLNRAYASHLQMYRMTGMTILFGRGSEVIQIWQSLDNSPRQNLRQRLAPFAVRAYCELGKIAEAANSLEVAKLPEARLDNKSLALTMLPFFCLSGAKDKVEKILLLLSKGKDCEPEYLRLYWWGRLLTVVGAKNQAKDALERSLQKCPANLTAVLRRIGNAIAVLEQANSMETELENSWSKPIDEAWAIFEKAIYVRNILSPSNRSETILVLMSVIVLSYAVSTFYTVLPNPVTDSLGLKCFELGVLDRDNVLHGQYWRLLTYLFLHANLLHLSLNLIALNWFGRIAENIFGTKIFLLIYFVSGAFSGLAHILLSPDIPAIGASGAIMGIFGAVAIGIFRLKEDIPSVIRRQELRWMALLALSQVVLDQIIPHVAAFAHLGGLLAGILIGLMVTIPKSSNTPIMVKMENS